MGGGEEERELEAVAACDTGSQSTRCYLFDADLQPLGSHQEPLEMLHPDHGWAEYDPLQIWEAVKTCMVLAYQEAEKEHRKLKIKALGLTNQRETTLVWHKITGEPLYNAMVWMDTRTSELCSDLEKKLGSKDFFRPVTGLPIHNYFPAFKFKWMYDNVEAVREAVDRDEASFGTLDSWIMYKLTGGADGGIHVTDVTNAARTQLMALEDCAWHEPFFKYFSMRPSALPRIVTNAEVYGHIKDVYEPFQDVPISGCLGDQMAALLVPGQRSQAGDAKNTYGTGAFMLLNTGERPVFSTHGLITTIFYKLGPDFPTLYALEGSVAVAGFGFTWLSQNVGLLGGPHEVDEVASQVPDSDGVYFVPAFSGLFAPRWDDTARGVILGLTGETSRAHIVRAMIEAICFQSREVLEAMQKDADVAHISQLRVDGGATKCNLMMQLQADVLQMPVVRPDWSETTVLGAALAAGLGIGFWTQDDLFNNHGFSTTIFLPSIPPEEAEERYHCWMKSVDRTHMLSELNKPNISSSQRRAMTPSSTPPRSPPVSPTPARARPSSTPPGSFAPQGRPPSMPPGLNEQSLLPSVLPSRPDSPTAHRLSKQLAEATPEKVAELAESLNRLPPFGLE